MNDLLAYLVEIIGCGFIIWWDRRQELGTSIREAVVKFAEISINKEIIWLTVK